MATINPSSNDARSAASPGKEPRTARGAATMRRLLDAAAMEFGERGFHDASISGITRRAATALGTFYTYFDSKDSIFKALVRDMSGSVAKAAAAGVSPGSGGIDREREALAAFLGFAREHKEIYRIIDEAEFAAPDAYRSHYEGVAVRIAGRLDEGVTQDRIAPGDNEVRAWAIMGMNVFLGLRFGVWDDSRPIDEIVPAVEALLRSGIGVSEGG